MKLLQHAILALALASTTNVNICSATKTTNLRSQNNEIDEDNVVEIHPRSNKSKKRPKNKSGYSCRKDLYVMGDDSEVTTTVSDDGLTIKQFAPLYGFDSDGYPDYTTPIGQYSSVDILIPVGNGAYTCQQTSFIGTDYSNGWFKNQVTASGICDSPGTGTAWEGSGGVSGGLGIYEGATGSMNWQCLPSHCNVALHVCVLDVDALRQN